MMPGRPITPTTEEKRAEENKKKKIDRHQKMAHHFTSFGSAVRATPGNILAALTHYEEEWKGVLAWDLSDERIVFQKEPPFHADAKDPHALEKTRPMSPLDVWRIAVWLEREVNLVIETKPQLAVLQEMLVLVAKKNVIGTAKPEDADPWREPIQSWLSAHLESRDHVKAQSVFTALGIQPHMQTERTRRRLDRVMGTMGFEIHRGGPADATPRYKLPKKP